MVQVSGKNLCDMCLDIKEFLFEVLFNSGCLELNNTYCLRLNQNVEAF